MEKLKPLVLQEAICYGFGEVKRLSIRVNQGIISHVSRDKLVTSENDLVIENINVAPGFVDVGTQLGFPGNDQREDSDSLINSAIHGGFSALLPFPNTVPVVDNASVLESISKQGENDIVDFLPIGSITKSIQGKHLTEMMDMREKGAIAFSDGSKPLENEKYMALAMQYAK